ncbi:MAG TPA: LysE family transporter [Ornithinibacter sp.]|nr:LysE family transporter [Ornithinibacter sp.]
MSNGQLLASALAGLGLGLGLIVAIGAQNAFVLRQGIRREHVLAVVIICIGSDAVLIVAGVAGAGALFTAVPWLVTAARWGGALFLLGYAALAARRALRPSDPGAQGLRVDPGRLEDISIEGVGEVSGHHPSTLPGGRAPNRAAGATLAIDAPTTAAVTAAPEPGGLLAVIGTALAFTWLNPHVYLDTFVLLGSVGSSHGQGRWAFAAGAVLGSALWFSALGLAARALTPVFARPIAWRVLDGIIAVVMTVIVIGLLAAG